MANTQSITITIDLDDQAASTRSLADGIAHGIAMYEEAFPSTNIRIDSYRTTDGAALETSFMPKPVHNAFAMRRSGVLTVPLSKRNKKPAE